MTTDDLLWPRYAEPSDLFDIESGDSTLLGKPRKLRLGVCRGHC